MMKYLAVAAIAIASMVMNTASAGFIPIDNFDGTPAGMQGTRTFGSTFTNFANLAFVDDSVAGFVTLGAVGTGTASVNYTAMNNIFLGGFTKIRLVSTDQIGTGTVGVSVNGSALQTKTLTAGGPYVFDFGPAPLTLTSLAVEFSRVGSGSGSIQLSSVQAVPEPATLALIGLVSAGGGVAGWRRRKVVAAV